jgi:NAD(P)-dependent dehydrogenase (short-subunit alcohol dehydrogenase family)
MVGRLQDKVAIVTGAGSGIGRAAALLFAAEGAHVVCADVAGDAARDTCEAAVAAGGAATAATVDVARAASVDATVAATVDRLGRVDVLYANAGVISHGRAADVDEAEWARVLGVNLTGVWHCARAVLPHMVAAGRGSVVTQASVGGLEGIAGLAAYCASKAGVIGLTRQMAVDYGQYGVRVNAIAPGTIVTPLVQLLTDPTGATSLREVEQRLAPVAATYPLRRTGTPEEVAAVALFLASDESAFMTGAVVSVDGGKSAV